MPLDRKAISNNIAKYRIMANISQIELAKRTGLNKGYISVLESGKGNLPSMEALNKIAVALGVDEDKLLFENLTYFASDCKKDEFDKELYFFTNEELEFVLSFLKIYTKDKEKIKI